MSKLVVLITFLIMVSLGAFWMFAWLIGTNSFSQSRGGAILLAQLLAAVTVVIGATWASVAVACRLQLGLGWQAMGAGFADHRGRCACLYGFAGGRGLGIALVIGGTP